jgi:hypothetical protein
MASTTAKKKNKEKEQAPVHPITMGILPPSFNGASRRLSHMVKTEAQKAQQS